MLFFITRGEEDMEQANAMTTSEQRNNIIRYVDFKHTELCSYSNPISCNIENVNIPFVGNWRDLLVAITEYCILKFGNKIEN